MLPLVLRVGVVVCIAIAAGTAGAKLRSALGIFDLRADTNAAYTYSQRAHTHPEWSLEGGQVLETARLWMPTNARYRVVYGPAFDPTWTSDFTHVLLYWFLLPRRPAASESTEWVFCYGCDASTLGDRFETLAGVEGGPTFGRLQS